MDISNLLKQRVSRKEFLGMCGACVLALSGITGILKTINENAFTKTKTYPIQKSGFGSDTYGSKGGK